MIIYKELSKQEIAIDAGTSARTVRKWCKQKENEMIPFGYTRKSQNLNPACVRILAEHFCFTPHNITVI